MGQLRFTRLAQQQEADVAVKETDLHDNVVSALAHRFDFLRVLCAVLKAILRNFLGDDHRNMSIGFAVVGMYGLPCQFD